MTRKNKRVASGATHVIATRGTDELGKAARTFDFILSTVSADLPWDEYLSALRRGGKLCIVGIPHKPISFSCWNLIAGERSIVGGQPGSIDETQQMLAFTAQHGIQPLIETFSMTEANQRWITRARATRGSARCSWRNVRSLELIRSR